MSPAGRTGLGALAVWALAACASNAAPRVDAVTPALTCDLAVGDTRVLRVTGTGLGPSVSDTLGSSPQLLLPEVAIQRKLDLADAQVSDAPVPVSRVKFTADGALELTLPGGMALPTGSYDVIVTAGNGSIGRLDKGLRVTPPAVAFYVDPQLVSAQAAFELTAWLDSPVGAPSSAFIELPGVAGSRRDLVVTGDSDSLTRFHMPLPPGLSAGDYTLTVTTAGGCVGASTAALHIETQTSFAITDLEPDVGVTGQELPVTLSGAAMLPTPRLFVRPSNDLTAPARPLIALDWQNGARVDAVVPNDLAAGEYDLIALSADRQVGVLPRALVLVTAPPLRIDAVTPQTLPVGATTPLLIQGSGFDNPTVRVRCRPTAGGAVKGHLTNILSQSATQISAELQAPPTVPSVCVVRVINSTTAIAQFSAITYAGGPASTLYAGVTLGSGRRAAGAATGRIRDRHILYVIGGDDGTPAGALATVETCKFDLFGRAAAAGCQPQPTHLRIPRSFLGAVKVGRFVYAVGGQKDNTPVAVIERAAVQSPEDSPRMASYDLELGDRVHGLDAGQWIYRVSARLPEGDPVNEGGETLASQPTLVVVPARAEKVTVHLAWAAVPGAVGYRIFRAAGAQAGDERLVEETHDSATKWTDTGMPSGTDVPLKPLQLGQWHDIGVLKVARAGAAVITARDPVAPGVTYLYVAGGRDASGAVRNDFERFTLTDTADGGQTVAGPIVDGGTIGTARAQLAAWSVDAAQVPFVGTSTWIYLGGGQSSDPADPLVLPVTDTFVGQVLPGGGITFVSAGNDPKPQDVGGAGALVQVDGLLLLGGGGAPSKTGASAAICSSNNQGNCNGAVPALDTWNNLGGLGDLLAEARYLMAAVRSGPFVFIVGGSTGTAAASTSIEGGAW